MTHISLTNMHSFALTLWQSHYCLCSSAVKARASPTACLRSPSRRTGCHQGASPSWGDLCWPSCSTSAWDKGSALLCERGEGRGKRAVTAGSEPPEPPQGTVSHPVAFTERVLTAASLLVCCCLVTHSLALVLPWLQRSELASVTALHCV